MTWCDAFKGENAYSICQSEVTDGIKLSFQAYSDGISEYDVSEWLVFLPQYAVMYRLPFIALRWFLFYFYCYFGPGDIIAPHPRPCCYNWFISLPQLQLFNETHLCDVPDERYGISRLHLSASWHSHAFQCIQKGLYAHNCNTSLRLISSMTDIVQVYVFVLFVFFLP